MTNQAQEIIEIKTPKTSCDGGKEFGHPKVYLEVDAVTGEVTCPYCSRVFVLKK